MLIAARPTVSGDHPDLIQRQPAVKHVAGAAGQLIPSLRDGNRGLGVRR
jgi:hypothetical protein